MEENKLPSVDFVVLFDVVFSVDVATALPNMLGDPEVLAFPKSPPAEPADPPNILPLTFPPNKLLLLVTLELPYILGELLAVVVVAVKPPKVLVELIVAEPPNILGEFVVEEPPNRLVELGAGDPPNKLGAIVPVEPPNKLGELEAPPKRLEPPVLPPKILGVSKMLGDFGGPFPKTAFVKGPGLVPPSMDDVEVLFAGADADGIVCSTFPYGKMCHQ